MLSGRQVVLEAQAISSPVSDCRYSSYCEYVTDTPNLDSARAQHCLAAATAVRWIE